MFKFIKQLRCKHVYKITGTYIDAHGRKNKRHVCDKCAKVKWEHI
jgi:hypothetical protein